MRVSLVRSAAALALFSGLGALAGLSGCGTSLPLPNEVSTGRVIPSDKSYQMIATWTGQDDILDLLLTQGSGSQLFLLFNRGGTGLSPRGDVRAYPLTRPTPIAGIAFMGLFNPVALASGFNRVFVLDQGDTCLARAEPTSGTCNQPGWDNRVNNFAAYWRVREYGLLGGDSISTFTDTTLAFVRGVAADAQGRVYVSGTAIIVIIDPTDSRLRTRTFQFRVHRYVRGPRYPGIVPADRNMPGSNWHRDTTWVAEEGSGIGTLLDPRGLFWSPAGGPALYAADFGKNWVQKLSDVAPSTGFYQIDAGDGRTLSGPTDVAVDLRGYVYSVDAGNRRVLRHDPTGAYVQVVNVERDAQGDSLRDPVAVAVDDSLVYVADATLGKVIRYKRRP